MSGSIAERQRAIAEQVRRAEAERPTIAMESAMQAGARRYPRAAVPQAGGGPLRHRDRAGARAALRCALLEGGPASSRARWRLSPGGDSGIGRSVAVLFAREGADVAILHLENEEEDAATVVKAVEAEGRNGLAIAGDVGDRAFCFEAVAKVVERFGKVDRARQQRGLPDARQPLRGPDRRPFRPDAEDQSVRLLPHGAGLPAAHARGSAIVNSGSVTALMGNSTIIDYTMTKGGIHAFTRALAGSLASRGIRVKRRSARPGVDAAQPEREPGKDGCLRRGNPHEAPGATGGDRAGLRVPRLAADVELHHRRDPPGDRRLHRTAEGSPRAPALR